LAVREPASFPPNQKAGITEKIGALATSAAMPS
jgi:hypothetical protein